ncbi:glycoside hydrolase family 2 TIM barrel-domain containing protein, partial [Paenibacillus sp.]|uniref:glycoside hydrolase family 2 TIM barrel-domain containing protein n=1 Tax=Paenibacillus sp. TaxID=58172 RepID=UPI0028A9D843
DYLDFSYFGGIYRDVYMIGTESLHVSHPLLSQTIAGGGVFVGIHDIEGKHAEIEIRTEIINEDDRARNIILRTTLETMEGTEIFALQEEKGIPIGETTAFIQQINATDVRLWHPDDPYLHFIRTELWEGDMLIDSLRTRFGIRLFEMRDHEGFFINKQRIVEKLSGVNRHQDYAYVGNALPNSGQWRDAVLIREGGSNIVRAAHYPLASSFMDACDELGLLVTVATPGWQYYNHEEPMFEQRVLGDTRAMARRDRNRPAVLLWETALNETDDQPISMLRKLHHIVHEEIPFPGVYSAADVISAQKADLDFYYHGNVPYNKCSIRREYGDGAEVDNFVSQNAMTRVKREWGEQAMLTQALIRAKDLNEMFSTPTKQIGATVWCGIDYQRGYHPDPFFGGLLDIFRLPRYSYYLFKSQHHPDFTLDGIETGAMVYITHELTQVSDHDVILFTNCDEVRLTWLGVEIGTQKPEAGYEAMPHPPVIFKDVFDFHEISTNWRGRTGEIEMVAEGLIAGKVVCRQVKKYPERLSGIRLEIDDVNIDLLADGSDFVPVRAVLIDNKGIPKVISNEYVHFTVEGPGEIIESSIYGVNPMRTQFGVATVLIRATTEVGEIQVTATSDGVGMDQIVLQSQAPLLPLLYDNSYACTSSNSNAGLTESQQTSATNITRRLQN